MAKTKIDWRSRMDAILSGHKTDMIPAAFRLDKWYNARLAENNMPSELASCSCLDDAYAILGLANPARLAKVCRWELRSPVEYKEDCQGDFITKTWQTPKGDLQMVQKHTDTDKAFGLMPCTVEYPIKSFDDYPAYKSLLSHTDCVPDYESYIEYDNYIGKAGLPMVILNEIPFHSWLGHWAGYQNGYMHLFDKPDVVLEAVEVANQNYRKMWQVVADSPARLVMHGVNFDTSTTPLNIYKEHFFPYLSEFCSLMHSSDKLVACHADGNNIKLLDIIKDTGFDAADCFACAPMVECTIEQARDAWKDKVTIWGGIPSPLLEPSSSIEQLKSHMEYLYAAIAPADRFIAAIADQVMPTATWEHLKVFLSYVNKYQIYPITV